MTAPDTRAQVEIGADTHARPDARELGDTTFRVLLLGDFSGASNERVPLERRVIGRVDRDGIDAEIARVAPSVAFSIDADAAPEVVSIRELDDFHPDRLLVRVPMLARLRALRTTAESAPVATSSGSASASGDVETSAPDTRSLLDRMLEAEPPLPAASAPPPSGPSGDDLADFVRRAVRPHVAKEVDPRQRALVAQVDDVIAAALRVLLHDPAFQALEALWRATDLFVRRCDAGDSATIGLLDVTRTELEALGTSAAEGSALRTRLTAGDGGAPWSLVIAAYHFGPPDVDRLATIAGVAEAMNTPWITAADSRLVGASAFADNGDADDWTHAPVAGWDDLRRLPAARFLGAALPRFLVRLPYGADNPVESLSFDELPPGTQPHERFLWGNPAFLAGIVAATAVDRGAPAPTHGTIGGLPLHIEAASGEALPCAETLLSQRTLLHILGRGLTPLASERDGDAVRIPRLQSIADPPEALPVRPAVRA
jgi:type VI secretion system protein ImpC